MGEIPTTGVLANVEEVPIPKGSLLQVVQIAYIEDKKCYKIGLSDSLFIVVAFCNSAVSGMIHMGTIKIFSIIELVDFEVVMRSNKIEILLNRVHAKDCKTSGLVGNPIIWSQRRVQKFKTPLKNHNSVPHEITEPRKCKNVFTQINQLTYYMTNFQLCARVVFKNISNATNKEGKPIQILSLTLADDTGEIRGTAFNDLAIKLNNSIDVDKVYYIKGGNFKYANTEYSTVDHKFELTFFQNSIFEPASTLEENIGKPQFNFVPINKISGIPNKSRIDVIGYVTNCGEILKVSLRNGSTAIKRTISIVDKTHFIIEATLWEKHTELVNKDGLVVAFKGIQVSEYFNRKQLTTLKTTIVSVDNDMIPEAHELKEMFSSPEGLKNTNAIPKQYISSFDNLKRITDIDFSHVTKDRCESVTLFAWLCEIFHKNKVTYFACPNPECKNKAMVAESDFSYYCNKCKNVYQKPVHRYTFTFKICDYTGSAIVHALGDDESTTAIMGIDPETYFERSLDLNPVAVENIFFLPQMFKLIKIRVRAQKSVYHDIIRNRIMMTKCELLNYGRAAQCLSEEIDKYD